MSKIPRLFSRHGFGLRYQDTPAISTYEANLASSFGFKRVSLFAAIILIATLVGCTVFSAAAYASGIRDLIPGSSQEASEPQNEAKYVMVNEKVYDSNGTLFLEWNAELDENGNTTQSTLRTGFGEEYVTSINTYTYDELGGIVTCIQDNNTHEEPYSSIVIVDEREGRVASYLLEDTVTLFEYSPENWVQSITYLYSGLSGTAQTYNDLGLPVAASDILGRAEDGSLQVEPLAELHWEFDNYGMPSGVTVRNAATGSQKFYTVGSDTYGNVCAVYDSEGNLMLEYEYTLVQNPSPHVKAMPPEYLSDICLMLGVPE